MEPSYLLRGVHAATVGTAQGDRCSCGPAQQAGKTIPLICHLIPLSTGLQPRSQAPRARYARLHAAAGFGWVGKQIKTVVHGSPEIPVPVTHTQPDNVEEIAS